MALPTITVPIAPGAPPQTINTLPNAGQQNSANSLSFVLASDQSPLPMQGDVAIGNTNSGNPVQLGGVARTQEAVPVSDGQRAATALDAVGKLIILLYANKENMVRGNQSSTGTTAVTLISAQGAGKKIYIAAVQTGNTGAANSIITLNDSASTVIFNPAGGGNNPTYPIPLVVAANTALTFTPSIASSVQYVSIQGYVGV